MMRNVVRLLSLVFLLPAFLSFMALSADAQRRDYLTDDEVELVRDAQQIDQRMKILTRAVDRRFAALGIASGAEVPKEKSDKWGPPPTGTRIELLDDIKRIIQKAVDDIDNLAERPDSIVVDETASKKEKPKKYEDVFPPAVRILAAAAKRYEPLLKKELESAKDEMERGIIIQSGDLCEEIIASESRLPATAAKKNGNR